MKKDDVERIIFSCFPCISIVFVFLIIFLPCFGNQEINITCAQLLFGLDGFKVLPGTYLIVLLPLIAVTFVLLYKKAKYFPGIAGILLILAGIFLLTANSYIDYRIGIKTNILPLGIASSVIFFISAVSCFSLSFMENELSVEDIVEISMLIGLAIVLDLPGLKIRLGANGGSLSFSMLPLLILSLRKGPVKGFLGCGVIYGILTCAIDGWGFVSYPFDYLLGYGSLAILGFFKPLILPKENNKITKIEILFLCVGVIISGLLRFLSSSISGVLIWELDFVGSMVYNAPSILGSTGICLAALLILYKPLLVINNRYKTF